MSDETHASGATVMVIDDLMPNALLAAGVLEQLPEIAATDIHEGGQSALDACRKSVPDLIVVDYLMPGMDGIAFIRRFREEFTEFVPIVVVTADVKRAVLLEALEVGATDFLRKPWDEAELQARARNLLALRRSEQELRRLAMTDALTGAFNRRAFMAEAAAEVDRAGRYGHPLTLQMLDIDHFKKINDTYGHAAGDEALKMFTATVQGLLRASDRLGRLGGEEFALLLPETDREGAMLLAERLRQALSEIEVSSEGRSFSFTTSIGVAARRDDEGPEDTLKRADAALYEAKEGGRNRVVEAGEDRAAG